MSGVIHSLEDLESNAILFEYVLAQMTHYYPLLSFKSDGVMMMMKIDDVCRHQGPGQDDAYISQDSGLMLLMFMFLLISSNSSSWDWSG